MMMVWDVVRGDTDGDVIGTVEAETEDEAWVLAKDKYDYGWRDRTQEEEEMGGYDTYNYIYIRNRRRARELTLEEKKSLFFGTWEDAVSDVCYYDRKGDEELHVDDVEELLNNNHVTFDEITQVIYKKNQREFSMVQMRRILAILVLLFGSVALANEYGMIRVHNDKADDVKVYINDYGITLKPKETKLVYVPAGKFFYKVGDGQVINETVESGKILQLNLDVAPNKPMEEPKKGDKKAGTPPVIESPPEVPEIIEIQPKPQEEKLVAPADRAIVVIIAPKDAKIKIDGQDTGERADVKWHFTSPILQRGTFYYTVVMSHEGWSYTKRAYVRPGEVTILDFTK
jgi:hypothetical protein